MEKGLWQQIEEIFYAALETPQEKREEFLRGAGAGDEALIAEVRALLQANRQTRDFLESPATLPIETPASTAHRKHCPKCRTTYPASARVCPEDKEILSLQDPYHLVGTTLANRYQIQALIGVGGMGAVYCAQHLAIDRRIALKILQPNLAIGNEYVLALFEREARLAGRLSHEHIVDVTDAGQTPEGIAYIAMEWLEGRTLDDELAAFGRLEFRRAIGILRQIASALCAAHAERIIHRDLKPANIMLLDTPDGRDQVKVLDFGIGKVLKETTSHSAISAVVGTPQYACPEQLTVGGHVDGRSDLYSLGVIFYRLIAGALPFQYASVSDLLHRQLHEPPRPLGFLRPETPPPIETLIARMLSKDPAGRPQSANELTASLDAILGELDAVPAANAATSSLESPTTGETAPAAITAPVRRAKRRGLPLGLAATALLLAGGYGIYRTRSQEPRTQVAPVVQTSPSPTPAPEPAPSPTPAPQSQGNPGKAAERLRRAQALYKQGEYPDALRECNESLRLDPNQAEARRLQRKITEIMRILNAR